MISTGGVDARFIYLSIATRKRPNDPFLLVHEAGQTDQTVGDVRKMVRVLILGAGGHARVVADAVLSLLPKRESLELMGFLDDDPELVQKRILGKPVLGSLADLRNIPHDAVVIGIGDNETRRRFFVKLSDQGEEFATVIHPRATLARDTIVGRGTVVFAGAIVNTGSLIGNNVIVNTGCTVDHNCKVGSHSHVCPGAHLGGTVVVGEGTFVGIGSTIINNITIGEWSIIGGGAAVIKDVLPNNTVVGVPARELPTRPLRTKPDTRDSGLSLFD
jgi:sugar O-acyltransferase (sialic acid O-acetyltransferase NeuD family)